MTYSRKLPPSGLDLFWIACSGAIIPAKIKGEDAREDFGGQLVDREGGILLALKNPTLSMKMVANGSECSLHDVNLSLQLHGLVTNVRTTNRMSERD